jgi:hypothetical protein
LFNDIHVFAVIYQCGWLKWMALNYMQAKPHFKAQELNNMVQNISATNEDCRQILYKL